MMKIFANINWQLIIILGKILNIIVVCVCVCVCVCMRVRIYIYQCVQKFKKTQRT